MPDPKDPCMQNNLNLTKRYCCQPVTFCDFQNSFLLLGNTPIFETQIPKTTPLIIIQRCKGKQRDPRNHEMECKLSLDYHCR